MSEVAARDIYFGEGPRMRGVAPASMTGNSA
jgi:hypothetical protein